MAKRNIFFGILGITLVWGGWLVYRNNRNNKIDKTPISYEDALKKLEKI